MEPVHLYVVEPVSYGAHSLAESMHMDIMVFPLETCKGPQHRLRQKKLSTFWSLIVESVEKIFASRAFQHSDKS